MTDFENNLKFLRMLRSKAVWESHTLWYLRLVAGGIALPDPQS
jgi:hypothetical protein